LYQSFDTPPVDAFDSWVCISADSQKLPEKSRRPDVGAAFEEAFDRASNQWFDQAKILSAESSAALAHTTVCGSRASDFGAMLAWADLVSNWIQEPETTLVLCDDPWVFRHLAERPGVIAGNPPRLLPMTVRLWLRGYAARCKVALRFFQAALSLPAAGPEISANGSWLLVYGHPKSSADGQDGYFGDLMKTMPHLLRVLHVDCSSTRARELGNDGRTFSLHAWGNPFFALAKLPFSRWRPNSVTQHGEKGWLVRRAAALEGGTGQAAAIRWQIHCQKRWLEAMRPSIVSWPWENHSWERVFIRVARALKSTTIGYQHSVIGRQMLSYSPRSNLDGPQSLPDRVVCSGASTRDQLLSWDMPASRLCIGGGLRFVDRGKTVFDPHAPVFVALPSDGPTASEMMEAVRKAGQNKHHFLVKDHPMTPFAFENSEGVERTNISLGNHERLSAVIFAMTTVGLEAVLLGLPTARFRPAETFVIDILPPEVTVPVIGPGDFEAVLENLTSPPVIDGETILANPDRALWTSILNPGDSAHAI
jgi:hypothetical protein